MTFRQFRNVLAFPALNALLLGSLYGVLVLYIALDHNPQGEFYREGAGIVLSNAIPLFLLAVAVASFIVFIIEAIVNSVFFMNKAWFGNFRISTRKDCFISLTNAILLAAIAKFFLKSWNFPVIVIIFVFVFEFMIRYIVQKISFAEPRSGARNKGLFGEAILPLINAFVLSLIAAGFVFYPHFQENLHNSFFEESGKINYLFSIFVFLIFFVQLFFVILMIEFLSKLILHFVKKSGEKNRTKSLLLPIINAIFLGILAGALFLFVNLADAHEKLRLFFSCFVTVAIMVVIVEVSILFFAQRLWKGE